MDTVYTVLDEIDRFVFTFTDADDPAAVTGEVTQVFVNNEGKNSDGTPDDGATAFVTTLTQSGEGDVTVNSVKWSITAEGNTKSCTASDDLPEMTFGGDGAAVTIVLAVDNLYAPQATAAVTVQ